MEKLVSVIIPAYNHEKYIGDAINSVLNQTYKNIELIVEDDCSTDNTVKEIKKIKDKRLKTIFSKKNKGTVRTINHLLSMCNGDYIAILGSDDIWYPEKIEKQLKHFKKGIGAVFSIADIIDENGNKYTEDENFTDEIFIKDNMSKGKRLRLFYDKGNHLCHPSSIITREVLEQIGLYNPVYRQLHDFDYWTRLLTQFNMFIVQEKLLAYRRFKDKNSNLSINKITNIIRHINESYNIIKVMFDKIDNKTFKEGFSDMFKNKNASSKIDLLCEKYFVLLKLNILGANNRQLAQEVLFNNPEKDEIIKALETKYKYSLNDIYNDLGNLYELYPIVIPMEVIPDLKRLISTKEELEKLNKNLSKELNSIYSSKSWKITKPIRKVTEMMSNGKHKN